MAKPKPGRMTATMDTDPIPPYAVTCWTNDREIFVALPMKDKSLPPYIMAYPLSEGGLAKAIEVLRARPKEVLSPTEAQKLYEPPKTQPQVKPVGKLREKLLAETTQEQRDAAQALLKKLGLIKS